MTPEHREAEGPMQDGPNTHRYRTYLGTSYLVVGYLDSVDRMHRFHVPVEVVNTILAAERERHAEALRACCKERDEARAEVERLRGLLTELHDRIRCHRLYGSEGELLSLDLVNEIRVGMLPSPPDGK